MHHVGWPYFWARPPGSTEMNTPALRPPTWVSGGKGGDMRQKRVNWGANLEQDQKSNENHPQVQGESSG